MNLEKSRNSTVSGGVVVLSYTAHRRPLMPIQQGSRKRPMQISLIRFTVVIALALFGFATTTQADSSAGCGLTPHTAAGTSANVSLGYAGLARGYRLHLPSQYDPNTPTPLVLSVHGYYSSGTINESWTGLSPHADANDYIVVYPESTSYDGGAGWGIIKSWNDLACNASPGPEGPICGEGAWEYPCPPECGSCNACDWCSCHDDLGFVNAVLDDLEARLCIDLDRVYGLGYSNGGMFAHRMACDLPERLAAVIPQHGVLAKGFNCATDYRMPIMVIGGTNDTTVPIDGSMSYDYFLYESMPEVVAEFASRQGCDAATTPYPTAADGVDGLSCVQHENCDTEAEVVFCQWNGDHDYPNGWGNDVFWTFLENNARPVPEPGAAMQFLAGGLLMALLYRRRRA